MLHDDHASLSRRRFLGAAAAATSLAATSLGALPALANERQKERQRLRGGEILPSPDFTLSHPSTPYLIGVRPHRTGGVRLEVEVIEGPRGKRHVIHNYGHSGAGITLSFGCARAVTGHLERLVAPGGPLAEGSAVAVVGTGIMGLTVATELRRRWPALPLTVYARDLDVKATTSYLAGGQFEPSIIVREYASDEKRAVLADYVRRSRDRIVEIQKSGQRELYGVAERKNYTLDHAVRAFDEFTPHDVVPRPKKGLLPFEGLKGVVGREYSTWLINPLILLPKLVEDLKAAGVRFEQRLFASPSDLVDVEQPVVVNCTGYGAKQLLSDGAMVPMRGHIAVLQKTHPRQFYFFSGGCANGVISYAFCRQNDIVVGGTLATDDESTAIAPGDAPFFERLLQNGSELFGGRTRECRRAVPG